MQKILDVLEDGPKSALLYLLTIVLNLIIAFAFWQYQPEVSMCFFIAVIPAVVALIFSLVEPLAAFFAAGMYSYMTMIMGLIVIFSLNFQVSAGVLLLISGFLLILRPKKIKAGWAIFGWLLFGGGLYVLQQMM